MSPLRGERLSIGALAVLSWALLACTGHDSASRARAKPAVPAPEAEPPTPAAEVEPAGFGPPGRYAVDIRRTLSGKQHRNVAHEDTRASFVLNLNADGQANACRGIRTRSSYNGPDVRHNAYAAEQQGYRGRWELAGEWLHIELNTDDTRCARELLLENGAPQRWLLRCRKLETSEHSRYAEPLLACALDNSEEHKYRESRGFFVPEVIAGDWLLLAPGDGLRVDWHDKLAGVVTKASKLTLKAAESRVEDDTWTKPE
ncbi:hypothetical protein [Nannocystis punicea]|uniref:Lipoprotein n=1 Tax=Nannocystis punicea TaxID=2995304 RepID=A0ABY7H3N9_9BACT|nr:hypothetical protein [Nannocystis poenicansa]WAS93710.1 hypothetical protein O0S08_46855 [Nannocystis poenicansa]